MQITREAVAEAVRIAIPELACRLPKDVFDALEKAQQTEMHPRGRAVVNDLVANARIASADRVPICQDTGTVWVCVEAGPDVSVPGDVFADVDAAVAEAYESAALRRSVVFDALGNRANTGDNTPAFTELRFTGEPGCALVHVMLKGGGSDNASQVSMLVPGAGREGIIETVIARVREKASSACAPLVVGIGVGATFDKVGGLAKHALMRPVGGAAASDAAAELERDIAERIAASDVGPGGLGGMCAALAVHVETAACHIAALPVAVNMGCSALRRATIDLADSASVGEQLDRQLVAASQIAQPCRDESEGQGGIGDAVLLHLPLDREKLRSLKAGQRCLLSGPLYTLRDAGHARLLAEMDEAGDGVPYGLAGQTIFYAGPTPAAAGRPFGAIGPTTAGRMDFAAPRLYDAGVAATIGKGARNDAVHEACKRNGSVFFVATGGAAALLAKQIERAEVVAYDDLGTEALRRIEVVDFPVFVGIDAEGNDVYNH